MIYILSGNNHYAIKQKLSELKAKFVTYNGDLQIENYDGAEVNIAQITNSLRTVSLFSSPKLIIIDELSANSSLPQDLEAWLGQVDELTTLILVEKNIDKRSSTYKTLKKQPNFIEYKVVVANELASWVIEYTKQKNGNISSQDARYLCERIGENQMKLAHELDKLVVYDQQITRDNIDLLTEQSPNSTIFNLIDCIFSGKLDKAMQIYDDQKAQQVAPQAIMGMIIWQLHIICVCLAGANKSAAEIAAQTGINNYVISKNQSLATKIGLQNAKEILNLACEIDIKSKNQTFDIDRAIKHFILRLDAYKNAINT